MKLFSYSFFLSFIICRRYEKGQLIESALSFAPLRPAGFVNYMGRAGLGQGLLFAGQGSLFSAGRGGAGQASLQAMTKTEHKI